MRSVLKAILPAAALLVGAAVTSAEAAPAGSGLAPIGQSAEAGSIAEKTYWVRRCHRTYHGVKCHRVWVKPYRPYRPYRRW